VFKRTGRDATGRPISIAGSNGFIEKITEVALSEASSEILAPALVDIQLNGYAGVDINAPEVVSDDLMKMLRVVWETGVGVFFPTVVTGSSERMTRSIRTIRDACRQDADFARSVGGIHIEGPYISPDEGPRGAHPLEHVRAPNWDEFQRWQEAAEGSIRLLTLSPEWENALRVVERVVHSGVRVAIGHTKATAEQIHAAVSAGAALSTHLGNGAHALLPRHPNYIWEQLAEDRLWASLIADGHHLPPATLKCLIRAKTLDRVIFTSDAVSHAGLPPGRYDSFESRVVEVLPNGRVQLAGTPYLAGAGLPLVRGVENGVRFAGLSFAESLRLATTNPARFMEIPQAASLEQGAAANLIRAQWDDEKQIFTILETIVGGISVYASE
jgi:N-acetylglucosamine-6-phosphate deacetylase